MVYLSSWIFLPLKALGGSRLTVRGEATDRGKLALLGGRGVKPTPTPERKACAFSSSRFFDKLNKFSVLSTGCAKPNSDI
mmetsp:Transcript_17976/g.47208  ORF Transcript_17976/g.47208 Transcript_17976/m.47208 type:complete len:80 (+) Transcript_17976:1142-1381(+)